MSGIKKRVSVNTATPGMVLAEDLLTENGQLILSKGSHLTAALLDNLKMRNISSLSVNYAEKLPPQFRTEKCDQYYADTLQTIESAFFTMRLCGELPLREMKEVALNSVLAMTETVGALQYLHSMRRSGEYTFYHSVSVSVLCGILGKWLGYKGEDLADLVLAGLLHDVGKTQVSIDLINKPAKLTSAEMQKMKQHSRLGMELIKKSSMLSESVIAGVLQHHERMDGSGYPEGARGDSIHPYARIIAVADLYDAVTSERPYNRKQSPFIAARIIADEMFGGLDTLVATTFLEHIRDHLVGAQVNLTDGRQAEVILFGGDFTFRPVIRTQNGDFVDIGSTSSVQIKDMVVV